MALLTFPDSERWNTDHEQKLDARGRERLEQQGQGRGKKLRLLLLNNLGQMRTGGQGRDTGRDRRTRGRWNVVEGVVRDYFLEGAHSGEYEGDDKPRSQE